MRRYLVIAFGCALLATGPVRADPGVTDKEILLGGTNALTGAVAAVCGAVSHGASAYFKKVNDAGGINGRSIRYTVLDDGYSAPRAIANTRRLIQQDGVFAMFGGCGTVAAAAVLSIVQKDGTPYLFPYSGLEELVQPTKPNVFSLLPLYASQLRAIVPYVLKTVPAKTAAIFNNNISGSAVWRQATRDVLTKAGVDVVLDELTEVNSPDRAPFVLLAKEKNPDIVVIQDVAPGSARFFLDMERQGWKPKMVIGTSAQTDESFLRAVGHAADGLAISPGIVLPAAAPESKECVDALAAYDASIPPGHFAMFGCLGAKVFVEELRRMGADPSRQKLLETLEGMHDFDTGISGPVSFSGNNHMGIKAFYPIGVENGAFKVLGPPIAETP